MPGVNEHAVCRKCRREGMKLFLKGERCMTPKCAIERRQYAPGEHGNRQTRTKVSSYGVQLREKQKVRHIYGIQEQQFRNAFKEAARREGITGERLLQGLESRLDNIVYRLGFAPSRRAARQLVVHRHFTVNGRITRSPSFEVKPGAAVQLREKGRQNPRILEALEAQEQRGRLPWLSFDKGKFEGVMTGIPDRESIQVPIREQLIVELYSK